MLVPFSCPQKCSCILQWKKLPLNLLVSPAFFTARPLGEILIIPSASSSLTIQHLGIWFYTALQWNCSQWTLSYWTECFFFWSTLLILFCLCNIYTIEQPFLDGVSSLEDVILCHDFECSHITLKVYLLKYTLRFCLQNASGAISSLRFLFYPCFVFHIWSKILDPYFQLPTWHFSLEEVILFFTFLLSE